MSAQPRRIRAMIFGDPHADRVVPPSGFTAQLTLFAAGAMAFLAVFALALALSTSRLASSWGGELAASATIRILAPPGEADAQLASTLRLLESTPGVLAARKLSASEQRALLAPWFGSALSLETLPVPQLVAVEIAPDDFDTAGLRLRLAAEAPGATLDDHGRWRAPLAKAANRLRWLAWGTGLLIAAMIAVILTLAANAALAANARVIAVLRLVGATDRYIAGAFIRRFALRTAIGATAGTLLGVLVVAALPTAGSTALLSGFGFRGAGWLLPAFIPVLSAAVALLATAVATRNALGDLS